jgi:hypothetical protein
MGILFQLWQEAETKKEMRRQFLNTPSQNLRPYRSTRILMYVRPLSRCQVHPCTAGSY